MFKDEVNGRNPIPACWLYNDMVVEPGSSSEIIVSEDDETPIQILLVTRGSVEVEVNTSSVEGLDHYSIELTRYYPQTKRTETKTYILDETTKIFKDDIFVGTKLMKQPDGSLRFEFVGVPEPNHVKSLSAVNADEDYYMETGILRAHTAEGYELTNWWYQPEGQDAQIVPDEGYQFGRVDKVTVSAEINEIIVPPTPDPEPLNPVNNNVNNGAAKTSDDNALMVIALLLVLTASICSVEALRRKQWNK